MPKTRKAYNSSVPTLVWHKGRAKWYIVFHHPATKTRQWKATGTADRRAAEDKLEEQVKLLGAESLNLTTIPTSEQGQTTVNQCLTLLVRAHQTEELSTAATIEQQLAPVRAALGAHRVSALTLGLLNSVRTAWRAAGYKKATINLRIAYLRRACRIAAAHGLLLHRPRFPILTKTGKGDGWPMYDCSDNVREGIVEPEELARVNAAEPEPAVRDFNIFAYWTGMRWGGIQGLTWDAFTPATFALRLHPRSSKNKKPLVYRLPPGSQLHATIARRYAERVPGCPWIFHIDGLPLAPKTHRWARAWKRAGLPMRPSPRAATGEVPARIFHDLRRTGLTNLINAGVREETAMKISGHRTRSVFERYVIGGEAEVEAAFAKVSQIGAVPVLAPTPLNPHAAGWQTRRRAAGVTRPASRVVRLTARTHRAPADSPATSVHGGA